MRSGFRAGKLFGITIRIDWSWLLIFALVTWNLSSVFGQQHADWSTALQWGLGLLAALLFFASVLAHELAHSLVAQARGVNVRSITLFLFGGVSNIQRHPDTPQSEFLITIVGPVTSFVLGVIFLLAGSILAGPIDGSITQPGQIIGQLGPAATVALLLGSVNVALSVFNLIPGFPLDGGRVLRSILWALTDSLRKATRLASWVGQGIAWLMMLGGMAMIFGVTIPFFGSGFFDGLWLIFIGWFLNSASTRSYRQIVIQDVLQDVPVKKMMRTNPPSVTPGTPISTLVHEHIMQSDDRAFPVMQDDKFVGFVALDDIRKAPREEWDNTPVSKVMTSVDDIVAVGPDADAADVFNQLAQADVGQIPVMENGTLIGLVRRQDIVKWLQLESELELGLS